MGRQAGERRRPASPTCTSGGPSPRLKLRWKGRQIVPLNRLCRAGTPDITAGRGRGKEGGGRESGRAVRGRRSSSAGGPGNTASTAGSRPAACAACQASSTRRFVQNADQLGPAAPTRHVAVGEALVTPGLIPLLLQAVGIAAWAGRGEFVRAEKRQAVRHKRGALPTSCERALTQEHEKP